MSSGSSMDDDEMLKRNTTDCVFFLASPLTCKKGMECEYRHNEIARLNPRDCWYWFAGNCLNPACGFRHPPLDLQNEAIPESTVALHQTSSTVKKTNVPCHFYYSGFCSKGNSCSFSHGPEWFTPPTGNTLKHSSSVTKEPPRKDEPIIRKAIRSNPVEGKLGLSRTFSKAVAQSELASGNVLKQSGLPEVSASEIETGSAGHTAVRSRVSTNVSLEVQVVTEEQNLSPGFHGLTPLDSSGNMYNEDNPEEHSPPYVQYDDELHNPSSGYKFEEQYGYDHMNPHAENFRGCGMNDSCGNSESPLSLDDTAAIGDEFYGGGLDFLPGDGGDLLHMELENGDCPNVVDLRDCLGRSRDLDKGHSGSWLWRRHCSSHSNCHGHTGLGRRGLSQRLHRRLTTLIGKNSSGSFRGHRFAVNGVRKFEPVGRSRLQSFRKYKGKRQLHATRSSRKLLRRGHRYLREETTAFAGPKTLNQIKEERMRAELKGENSVRCSSTGSSVDFQGPKPLSDLLKNKAE